MKVCWLRLGTHFCRLHQCTYCSVEVSHLATTGSDISGEWIEHTYKLVCHHSKICENIRLFWFTLLWRSYIRTYVCARHFWHLCTHTYVCTYSISYVRSEHSMRSSCTLYALTKVLQCVCLWRLTVQICNYYSNSTGIIPCQTVPLCVTVWNTIHKYIHTVMLSHNWP